MIEWLEHIDQELLLLINGWHSPLFDFICWNLSKAISLVPFYVITLYFLIKDYSLKKSLMLLGFMIVTLSITDIVSTQVFTALSPIIRKNITQLYCYRLRNYRDLETILEELAALIDKKTLLEIYQQATKEKHSFLYINLMESDINSMFSIRFDKRILID
mgnify:CR=1 FL=1